MSLLMLCCNDYRNGIFAGHFSDAHFDFGSGFNLHLSCNYCDAEFKCAELSMHGVPMLKVGRKTVRTYCAHEWHGNWCWNSYVIRPRASAMLLNYLRDTKGFSPESGSSALWDLWRSGETFTVEAIRQAYWKSEAEMGR